MNTNGMTAYAEGIWDARHFWVHLALSDLRARWRRSFFGVFWSMLQPLGMTLLLTFVFSRLFHTDITHYAPYVLSGVIVWDCIMACFVGGSMTFVQADAYIKQCKHPLAIYSLRTVLTALLVLLMATVPLIAWVLVVMPENISLSWLAVLTFYPLLLMMVWPIVTFLAYVGVRFRDLSPALALLLQALWFISPVYFEEKMFRNGGLGWLVDYNPIYHLLQILRAPLLTHQWPTLQNYVYCIGFSIVFFIAALIMGVRSERKVIFYL